jgi:hypothetical protein
MRALHCRSFPKKTLAFFSVNCSPQGALDRRKERFRRNEFVKNAK